MDKNKEFLGTESVGKLLFKLAVPTVIAQLVNMLYNIVDRIYIGHIPEEGSLALTGVGVCMPIIMIISAFAALISSGGAPRASINMGKGDKKSAEKILGGCFTLQIIISAVLTAVFADLEQRFAPRIRCKRKHNRLCRELYEYLCRRHCFCSAYSRNGCIYQCTGLHENRYGDGAYRCRQQHNP